MGFLKSSMSQFNSQFDNPMDRVGFGLNMVAQGGGADAGYTRPINYAQQPQPMQQPMQQSDQFRNVFQMIGQNPMIARLFGMRG